MKIETIDREIKQIFRRLKIKYDKAAESLFYLFRVNPESPCASALAISREKHNNYVGLILKIKTNGKCPKIVGTKNIPLFTEAFQGGDCDYYFISKGAATSAKIRDVVKILKAAMDK